MPFTISGVDLIDAPPPAPPRPPPLVAKRVAQASESVCTFDELICVSGLKRRPE